MHDDPKLAETGVSRRDAVVLAAAAVLLGKALGAPRDLLAAEAGARSMLRLEFYVAIDKSSPKLMHTGELPDDLSRMILEQPEIVQLKIGSDRDREPLGAILMSDLLQGKH